MTSKYSIQYAAQTYMDYTISALKTATESWYTSDTGGNLDAYENYIETSKFCNDTSIYSSGTSLGSLWVYYGALGRFFNNNAPQYKCPVTNDELMVGHLTADEVSYAGGQRGVVNSSYYLYNNAQTSGNQGLWWLLSPSDFFSTTISMFYIGGSDYPGLLSSQAVNNVLGCRPVISLKSNVSILSGVGTSTSPYVITN